MQQAVLLEKSPEKIGGHLRVLKKEIERPVSNKTVTKFRDPIEKWEFKHEQHAMQFGVRIFNDEWCNEKTAQKLTEEIQKKTGLPDDIIRKNLCYVMTREFGVDISHGVLRHF
jgi:hypothetical protein